MPDLDDPRVERAMMEMERDMEHLDENNPRMFIFRTESPICRKGRRLILQETKQVGYRNGTSKIQFLD